MRPPFIRIRYLLTLLVFIGTGIHCNSFEIESEQFLINVKVPVDYVECKTDSLALNNKDTSITITKLPFPARQMTDSELLGYPMKLMSEFKKNYFRQVIGESVYDMKLGGDKVFCGSIVGRGESNAVVGVSILLKRDDDTLYQLQIITGSKTNLSASNIVSRFEIVRPKAK
jgi:hypothetical protein